MRSWLGRLTLVLLPFFVAGSADAYRRLKWGPFELVPSMSMEVRQHSNVFVTSEDAPDSPTKDISGFIVDVRPGLTLAARPNLARRVRGLYVDFKYTPALILFPSSPEICGAPGLPTCESLNLSSGKPDTFKLDHGLNAGLRYQMNSRLSLFGQVDYTHPELSQADVSLNDFTFRTGGKYDFTRTMSVDGSVAYKRFNSPVYADSDGDGTSKIEPSPFGSFDEYSSSFSYRWAWKPTLELSATYWRSDRRFESLPQQRNDRNGDGVPDSVKDYIQQSYFATVSKRLTRQTRGSASVGRSTRTTEARQFGSRDYATMIGSGTLETLLTKRTRLQFSAEYALTDTIREITFSDLNAFTNDQTGQFSVLAEQFSVAYDQRYLIDIAQNVFRRGDQVLLGFAYQKDRLRDQLGGQNFFEPNTPFTRDIFSADGNAEGICEDPETKSFCQTVLNDQVQTLYLFTGGYRLRLPGRFRFLGLQARGTYFSGETRSEFTEARQALASEADRPPDPTKTNYWALAFGMVINLQVFQ